MVTNHLAPGMGASRNGATTAASGETRRCCNVSWRAEWRAGQWTCRPIPTGIDLAAAKQLEERHGMRGTNAVGVSHHNQGGRLDRRHFIGPVIVLPEQFAELGEQHRPILRLGRDTGIALVHRGLLHRLRDLRTHLPHSRENFWVPSLPLEWSRDEHELSHHFGCWMAVRRATPPPSE